MPVHLLAPRDTVNKDSREERTSSSHCSCTNPAQDTQAALWPHHRAVCGVSCCTGTWPINGPQHRADRLYPVSRHCFDTTQAGRHYSQHCDAPPCALCRAAVAHRAGRGGHIRRVKPGLAHHGCVRMSKVPFMHKRSCLSCTRSASRLFRSITVCQLGVVTA